MTILNEAELLAERNALFPDNTTGEVSPADVRQHFQNMQDSLMPNGASISDGADTVSVTSTPTKLTTFDVNDTSPTPLYTPDAANDRIRVKEPGLYFITFKLQARWPSNEDFNIEVRVNGAINPVTPLGGAREGGGSNDPVIVSSANNAFVINSTMITDGGGFADVELYCYSTTGSFTWNQDDLLLALEYNQGSIRTVG